MSAYEFPPTSAPTFPILQWDHRHDPFKLAVVCYLLNQTRGSSVRSVLEKVLDRFPTAAAMSEANQDQLEQMVRCLGFGHTRSRNLIRLAQDVVARPISVQRLGQVKNYPGLWEMGGRPTVGRYSIDSFRIFALDILRGSDTDLTVTPEWRRVLPADKELQAWLMWRWLKDGYVWDRETGARYRACKRLKRRAMHGATSWSELDQIAREMRQASET